MKTILVNEWDEHAFPVVLTETKTAETVRTRISRAMRALAQQQLHAVNKTVRKTLRATELALWQATGGDFLAAA